MTHFYSATSYRVGKVSERGTKGVLPMKSFLLDKVSTMGIFGPSLGGEKTTKVGSRCCCQLTQLV